MDAASTTIKMSADSPLEIDLSKYPHIRRMALFIVCVEFFLMLQILVEVVGCACFAGPGIGTTLSGWVGAFPIMALGIVASRRLVLHKSDAIFLCKSFGWLILAFKALTLLSGITLRPWGGVLSLAVEALWVLVISAMIWAQYGSPELKAAFPRHWRTAGPVNVTVVGLCAIGIVALPVLWTVAVFLI